MASFGDDPRTCHDVISAIRGNCKQILGAKFWNISCICPVEASWKNEKSESKIFILSKFRLFILTYKSAGKTQIEHCHNILALSEIFLPDKNEILLDLSGRKLHMRTCDHEVSAADILLKILQAYKHYFPKCDLRNVVQIHPPSYYLVYERLPPTHFSLPCDGFRRTYAAVCDSCRSPYREEIIWDIEKIYCLHDLKVLNLNDFNYFASRDLVPLVSSLQFNGWFYGISMKSTKMPTDLIEAVQSVVRKSGTLRKLHLRNCGLKSDFLLGLCSALNANPSLPLEDLDLSENSFDESKNVVHFCGSLSSLKTLEVVKFENCGLSAKSVHALCAALCSHQEKFRVFSLADNLLKDDSRLNSLLNLLGCCSVLEELDLSGTSIALDRIWACLKKTCSSLHTLKLARCVFPAAKCKDISLQTSIKDFFASCACLKYVDMAACSIPAETLKFLLLGLVCNQAISDVYLNLNSIAISDRQCFSVLETCAPNLRCVSELAMRDNNMEVLASDIMQSLSRMPHLQRLNIGGANFTGLKKSQHRSKPHIVLDVVEMITSDNVLQWVESSGSTSLSLTELNLSDCHLGNALSPILNALGSAPVLKILNISGNDIGNVGARLLAKALQINDSLESVHVDQNQIGIEGYDEILNALAVNSSLVFIPYPMNDISECFKLNKERTEKIWLQIQLLLRKNFEVKRARLKKDVHSENFGKFLLISAEEKLNKAMYQAQELLARMNVDEDNSNYMIIQSLFGDCEIAKQMFRKLMLEVSDGNFLSGKFKELTETFTESFNTELRNFRNSVVFSANQMELTTIKNPSACLDTASGSFMEDTVSSVSDVMSEFAFNLQDCRRLKEAEIVGAFIEKLSIELLKSLKSVCDKMVSNMEDANISPPLRRSSESETSKNKLKFVHSRRPKSIVEKDSSIEGRTNSEDQSDAISESFSEKSIDDMSLEFMEIPRTDAERLSELRVIQKTRPKPPRKNPRSVVMLAPVPAKSESHAIDYTLGVDSFFGSNVGSRATETKQETVTASEQKKVPVLFEPVAKDELPAARITLTNEFFFKPPPAPAAEVQSPTVTSPNDVLEANSVYDQVNLTPTEDQKAAVEKVPIDKELSSDESFTKEGVASVSTVSVESEAVRRMSTPSDNVISVVSPASSKRPSLPPSVPSSVDLEIERQLQGFSDEGERKRACSPDKSTSPENAYESIHPELPAPITLPPRNMLRPMRPPKPRQHPTSVAVAPKQEPPVPERPFLRQDPGKRQSVTDLASIFDRKPPARPVPPPRVRTRVAASEKSASSQ